MMRATREWYSGCDGDVIDLADIYRRTCRRIVSWNPVSRRGATDSALIRSAPAYSYMYIASEMPNTGFAMTGITVSAAGPAHAVYSYQSRNSERFS